MSHSLSDDIVEIKIISSIIVDKIGNQILCDLSIYYKITEQAFIKSSSEEYFCSSSTFLNIFACFLAIRERYALFEVV